MKVGYVKGKPLTRSGHVDAATNGTTALDIPPRIIEVTASNTYRLYSTDNKYRSKYMYKGIEYDGEDVVFATDSAGTALTAGIMYFVY